jgi:hypothetical protein
MNDIVMRLVDAPIARMFVLSGIIFLLIAVLGKIEGKIEPGKFGRIGAAIFGLFMMFFGVFMQNLQTHELGPEQIALLQQTLMLNNAVVPVKISDIAAPAHTIKVVAATYGRNCNGKIGNATVLLAKACDEKNSCDYAPEAATLENPTNNCNSDLAAEWKCGNGSSIYTATLPADASKGEKLRIACSN